MSIEALEKRITALETEFKQLKQQSSAASADTMPWWEKIRGQFKDDPIYEEAMRLGREYRESLRPKEDEGL